MPYIQPIILHIPRILHINLELDLLDNRVNREHDIDSQLIIGHNAAVLRGVQRRRKGLILPENQVFARCRVAELHAGLLEIDEKGGEFLGPVHLHDRDVDLVFLVDFVRVRAGRFLD